MTTFPGSPRLLKAAIVLLDPATAALQRVITLQYSPHTLSRTFQVQGVGDQGERSEVLRLKAPPVETLKVDAELDAADQLEVPDRNPATVEVGIHPQLAALELLVYPTTAQQVANHRLAGAGTLEILPMQSALTLFVWSKQRIVPVRITELSVTEEAFDPALNPLRAKVGLGLRVLSVHDIGFDTKGGSLFLAYQRQKERLAERAELGGLADLGLGGIA